MRKILLGLALLILMAGNANATVGWNKSIPATSENPQAISPDVIENNTAVDLMLQDYRSGHVTISLISTSEIDVGPGGVMLSNAGGSVRLMVANAALTAVSSTMIDTGTISASSTYYLYAYASSTTATTFSVIFSASATSPTGITYYTRLGSFTTDGSKNFTSVASDVQTSPAVAYSYGTSSSASTQFYSGIKIAYGNIYVGDNTTVTITNLPFTSSGTYAVSISSQFPAQSPPVSTNIINGSSFSIQNIDGGSQNGNINWIAIGT